jgi:hypothetical protein
MKRLIAVLPVLVVAALAGTGPAAAESDDPGCAFTLSQPQVADQSGTPVVTATVAPAACNRAEPMLQVVCLEMVGRSAAPLCVQADGPSTARVYFAPFTPGATYTATGRGCANAGNPTTTYCRSVGPATATL